MKLLKKIAIAAVMTASMLAVSSMAVAAENKDSKEAKDAVIKKAGADTKEALVNVKGLLEKGGDTSEQIKTDLNNARQFIKEYHYEAIERLRQKMNDAIKNARLAFLAQDNEKTLAEVNQALSIYAEMEVIYDAGHK